MPRSRTGCANCRKRKRKCDETWPECRACRDRGLRCGGSMTRLRWGNGIASRGRFAGATTPARAPAVQAIYLSSSPVPTTVSAENVSVSCCGDNETTTSSCSRAARSDNSPQHELFRQCKYFSLNPRPLAPGSHRYISHALRDAPVLLYSGTLRA